MKRSDIDLLWADCNEPDAVGCEASHHGKLLFSIYFEESGTRSIRFSFPADIEFDAAEYRELVNEVMERLEQWDIELRGENGAWSEEVMRELR